MSPDRDLGRPDDEDLGYGDDVPRSVFSALWFRALLAILILGVIAAVAVPYVLDFATPPTPKAGQSKGSPAPAALSVPVVAAPSALTTPAAAPTAEPPAKPAASEPATPVREPATAKPAPAKPAPAETPKPTPAAAKRSETTTKPEAKPEATSKRAEGTTKRTEATAKRTEAAKRPEPTDKSGEERRAATKTAAAKPSPTNAAAATTPGGSYWVQVGAFKDAGTAGRVAARLREQGLRVEQSTTAAKAASPPPPAREAVADRYDVVVSGAAAADVDAKLAAKGMTGETTASGVVARPSLPLREAVALSRELADAGLSVQVRRVSGPAPAAAASPTPAASSEATLHRVRVGGFPDRATASAAAKQLEEKGYKPFIARGNE